MQNKMAKKNYDAINFKNKDIDRFSTKFGNGDPVKGQGPQKVDYGKKMMEFDKPSLPNVNIRSTDNTFASDKTSVKTAPKPTGPSKPSWQLAAAQRQVENDRKVDKATAEYNKKEAAKKQQEAANQKYWEDKIKAQSERDKLKSRIRQ